MGQAGQESQGMQVDGVGTCCLEEFWAQLEPPDLCLPWRHRQLAKVWGSMRRREVKVLLTREGRWLVLAPVKVPY